MQRRTELILAALVAMAGMAFGAMSPVQSTSRSWSAQDAILSSFQTQDMPAVSTSTARTTTEILGVRQVHGSAFAARNTRFEIADLPGDAELFVELENRPETAFQRNAASTTTQPRDTTALRVGAEVGTVESGASLTPYAGLAITPEGTEGRVGAQLVVGDGRGAESRWFFFAAAERQAVFYDTNHMTRPLRAIDITPYSVIGDGQAGIAYRVNENADLALAYVRREWAYHYGNDDWREAEDFAAISFMARW